VFSWNSPDFFENEFDDLKNIEIKAIPKPILEIYKALNG
jgi:adenine-specific DNA-methyltransferase